MKKMKIACSLLFLAVLFSSCDLILGSDDTGGSTSTEVQYASNVIVVSDTITSATTWLDGKVYYIPDARTVDNGATLTIQPGAIVKFGPDGSLTIQDGATIVANGTSLKPIYVTSIRDTIGGDSILNDTATAPAAGDWHYIWIQSGSNSNQFAYTHFRYGGKNGEDTLLFEGRGSIDHCSFYNNQGSASPWTYNEGAALTITEPNQGVSLINSVFYNNNWPLSVPPTMSLDGSNGFSYDDDNNAATADLTNTYQGIWLNTIVSPADTISTNVSWGETEVPYCLLSDKIYISNTGTLQVAPEVAVKCSGTAAGFDIDTDGTMTFDTTTCFTSYKDDTVKGDTNQDGDATTPAVGDWDGIWDGNTGTYRTDSNITYAANN